MSEDTRELTLGGGEISEINQQVEVYSEESIFSSSSARQLGRENPGLSNLGNTSDCLGIYILAGLGQVGCTYQGKQISTKGVIGMDVGQR